jgi:FKBP-type peptidyl-prolyl cis-trans isomerase
MKSTYKLFWLLVLVVAVSSCDKVNYKKTKSGLIYKIIPSNSKDSVAKIGDMVKIHFVQLRVRNGDSLLNTTYGKMPYYQEVVNNPDIKYNPVEIFPGLKKGDSVVVIMLADSLYNKKNGRQMPEVFKKGDRLELRFKVLDVFKDPAKFQADREAEMAKDAPRAAEDQKKQMAQRIKQLDSIMHKEMEAAEKSGDAPRQRKQIEDYLAAKKINAQKTPEGTYVVIKEQGTGVQAEKLKYLSVKYAGRLMSNDSTFDSGIYPYQMGTYSVVQGWDDAFKLFKEGGKGTLYIPAYRAYGKQGQQGSIIGPDAALIFEVELLSVSDTPPAQQGPPGQ